MIGKRSRRSLFITVWLHAVGRINRVLSFGLFLGVLQIRKSFRLSALFAISMVVQSMAGAQGVPRAAAATISNLQVRLIYKATGRLSQNVARPGVDLWNTCIGEGYAGEEADNALFSVDVTNAEKRNNHQPITLTAFRNGGRVIASKTFYNIATNGTGRATLQIQVPNVGCAGRVTFGAQIGVIRRAVTVDFASGE